MEMHSSSAHIKGFNGLRALAVTLVFLDHKARIHAFNLSDLGVWMFFVLSGYLIIGELHRQRCRIEASSGDSSVRAQMRVFFTKRALRIFPVYYAVLCVLLVLQHFYRHAGPDLGFAYHFTYLSNVWIGLVTGHWVGPFGVFWSLAVEQQFYLVAPFVFLLTPSRLHPLVCIAAIVAGGIAHVAMYATHVDDITIYVLSPWNFSILAIGGLGYMLSTMPGLRRVVERVLKGPPMLAVGVAGIVFFAASAQWLGAHDPGRNAWFDFALTFSVALVVLWIVHNQSSLVAAALELRLLAYFGTISYGFYLMHNFIPNPLGPALAIYGGLHVSPTLVETLGVLLDFAFSVLAAGLSWRFLESPVMALRKRITSRRESWPDPAKIRQIST
ncbi:acyltransferase family protein [Paraburkholderia sp.]|uniref:acyltransferase family protein n=1 Tax=Paraburkholderia sp. TaxID=1926495 RepID=UPI003D6FA790